LARLLHPDHQQDERLKVIAEKQLRRVNRIYAVLSDPERRRRYDEMLDEEFHPTAIVYSPTPGVNISARKLISRFVWAGVTITGVILALWITADQPSVPIYSAERPAASARSSPPQPAAGPRAEEGTMAAQSGSRDEVSLLKSELRTARGERDEARRELDRLRGSRDRQDGAIPPANYAGGPSAVPALQSLGEMPPPHLTPAPPPHPAVVSVAPAFHTARPPGSDPHQFAGFWYFAKGVGQRPKNLYPPEFIEATLSELNGVVHGKYRSRYQIVDRAISPDVNFEFSGTPSGPTVVCPWAGPGGARGQLTLRMTDENDLRVDWTASDMGSVQGLASGTAILTRGLQ
jgi:hypothetical protein